MFKKIETLSVSKTAIALFLLAFILRFSYSLVAFDSSSLLEPNAYIHIAKEILEQGKMFYYTSDPYYDAASPVMPWLNALTMLIFGQNNLGIFLITAIGSALITLFTYKLAGLYFDKITSLLVGIWSVGYFAYFHFTPIAGKDIWMAFFMIYFIFILLKLFDLHKFSYPEFILFTLLFVISFHLDERYFIFTPFIFIYILISETNVFKTLRIKKSFVFIGLVILLMIPWTIRNYYLHDKIVLLSTRTERLTDPFFGYEQRENAIDQAYQLESEYYLYDYQIDSVLSGEKTITDFGYSISEAQRQFMLKGNLPRPFTKSEAFFSRISSMYRPILIGGTWERSGYFYYERSLMHNMVSLLFYGSLLLFSFPGFYFLFKKNRTIFYLLLSTILIYTLIHALTIPYTNWRYRMPLDSIFIIVGSYGMITIIKKFGMINKMSIDEK